ncbi:MAG TPA: hypothetical protein VJP85_00525 [Candidatus Baltobacteraceae bacterium]|nr:hypothetical protein [Candidatus Baltobacteraceae bacterium]
MTHIYERLFLQCPYVRAREYLREALQAAADGKMSETLPLTAPIPLVPGALEKSVLVRYERGRDPLHFDEPWNVYWTPEGGGPYPDFAGQMTVRADESYRGAILELAGDYAPPFGAVGRAFDMALGAKIASATAKALLHQIALRMEERYQSEEAAKNQATG